jgi:hypothetical protein
MFGRSGSSVLITERITRATAWPSSDEQWGPSLSATLNTASEDGKQWHDTSTTRKRVVFKIRWQLLDFGCDGFAAIGAVHECHSLARRAGGMRQLSIKNQRIRCRLFGRVLACRY